VKPWQIFTLGIIGLLGALSLVPFLESAGALVAVLIAVVMIAVVIAGFSFVPDRDSWQVWVTRYSYAEGEDDIDVFSTQEPIAIRVDVARLWLLYLPTVLACAFLVLTALRGLVPFDITTHLSYPVLLAIRWGVAGVWLLLASWIYERWLLRRAEATQAQGEEESYGQDHIVSYYFVVGESYYGGWSVPLFSYHNEPALAQVVIHSRNAPDRNRLVRAFLFHRFQIAGRGVQDLELAREYALQPVTEPLE
jgi:hypothetical protein